MAIVLKGKNILSLDDLSDKEIRYLLNTAGDLKAKKAAGIEDDELLPRKVFAYFGGDNLTEHRFCIETACFDEGAHLIAAGLNQIGGRYAGITGVAGNYTSALVFDGLQQSELLSLAEVSPVPIINFASDKEWPIDTLSTVMTLESHTGTPVEDLYPDIEGLGGKALFAAAVAGKLEDFDLMEQRANNLHVIKAVLCAVTGCRI